MSDLAWKTDVQLACSGDRDAFARLVRGSQNELYGMTKSLLRSDEDCADAIQETILKAYRGIGRLREPAFFRTWLFRILINECRKLCRRQSRVSPADKLPERAAGPEEADLDLRDAVEGLDESLRTLVKLHYYADVPLAEISAMLDVPEGTLKSRLHKARRLLEKRLSNRRNGKRREGIGYEY